MLALKSISCVTLLWSETPTPYAHPIGKYQTVGAIRDGVTPALKAARTAFNFAYWLHSAILASPRSNNLNKKLLSYATENVTAAVGLVQKFSQAKNLEDVVRIQAEFMSQQLNSFNEQTKAMVEMCTKAAQDITKPSS
jgi:hypothetical protein